jgi:toxin ParE1/3/4
VAVEIVFAPRALDDLLAIYVYVAEAAGADVADAYDARLRKACLGLANFPRRGRPRDDLGDGVRTMSFERRAVIAYRVEDAIVRILRVLHHGRDLGLAF